MILLPLNASSLLVLSARDSATDARLRRDPGKDLAWISGLKGCQVNAVGDDHHAKVVYWHRELPPLEAELVAEHTVEATSSRVEGTIGHRDELWDRCYQELMAAADHRLTQEVARLGGDFAHVHDETIDPKHDAVTGEAWLHGRFSYMLYRRARGLAGTAQAVQ